MESEGLSNIIAWISYCSLSLAMHQSHKQLCRGETEGLPSADTRCWAGLGRAGLGWAGLGEEMCIMRVVVNIQNIRIMMISSSSSSLMR